MASATGVFLLHSVVTDVMQVRARAVRLCAQRLMEAVASTNWARIEVATVELEEAFARLEPVLALMCDEDQPTAGSIRVH